MLIYCFFVCYIIFAFASADCQHFGSTHICCQHLCSFACTACAENKHLSAFHVNSDFLNESFHSVVISVVAVKSAVFVDDCVDSTDAFCNIAHGIKIRYNRLLIRNSYIYCAEIFFGEEICNFIFAQLNEFIFIICKFCVNFF